MKKLFTGIFIVFGLLLFAHKGFCGGGGQIIIDQSWISTRSTTLCYDKKTQDYCYNESKACRDEFEKGITDLLNNTCPIQNGDWWCDPDPNKDLAKINSYVDNFKQTAIFQQTLKACNPAPLVCGDHILNGNEECDDGNNQDGDGCSGKCVIEPSADVETTCYQNLHDGACKQKKEACDQIQGDKNCPEQLNQCLQDAMKTCKNSHSTSEVKNTDQAPTPGAATCSVSPRAMDPNFPFSVVFLIGLVPIIRLRVRKGISQSPHMSIPSEKEIFMKRKLFTGSLLILVGVASLFSLPGFAADPPPTAQSQQTISLVDKAAALLASKGKAAFPEFKVNGSEWWLGDTYIYVYDLTGTPLMHPIYPQYEGVNLITMKDIQMKAFVQQLTEIAKTKGSGWFDFMLPRPGQAIPSHKFAYIRTVRIPEGETLIVGSGFWAKD